jgi:hypothetical protein
MLTPTAFPANALCDDVVPILGSGGVVPEKVDDFGLGGGLFPAATTTVIEHR